MRRRGATRAASARRWLPATLAFVRDPLAAHRVLQARHGDPFPTFLGPVPAMVTACPAGTRALFAAPADSFAPSSLKLAEMTGVQSVLALEGAAHRDMRRKLSAALLDGRDALSGPEIAAVARRHIAAWPRQRTMRVMPLMARLSLETILRSTFGLRNAAEIERFALAFAALTRSTGMLILLVPGARRDLGAWSPWGRYLRARRRIAAMIAERSAAARRSGPGAAAGDALARLVWLSNADGSPALDDDAITDNLLALLNAGHMSTASALAWAVHWVWSTPGILPRLRADLAAFAATGDAQAALRVPYLDAVCRESLRIRPVAPLVARQLARPLELAGRTAAAGTMVGASIDLAHHDPAVFADPDRFDPERFLGRRVAASAFFPFGGGHRHCLGAWLAMDEMRLVLAVLATGTTLRLASTKTPKRVFSGALLVPKGGVKIVMEGEAE